MKKLTCFLLGALGTIVTAIALAIIVPQYSDYRAAAITGLWQPEIRPLQAAIEENILNNATVSGSGMAIGKHTNISTESRIALIKVTDSGAIIIKGENRGFMTGQVMVLLPELVSGKVLWTLWRF